MLSKSDFEIMNLYVMKIPFCAISKSIFFLQGHDIVINKLQLKKEPSEFYYIVKHKHSEPYKEMNSTF